MLGDTGTTVGLMSTLLTNIGSIVTAMIDMVADWLGVITTTGNELLLLCCLVPFVGLGIHYLKLLTSVR